MITVIAIIGLLTGLLFPVISSAMNKSKVARTTSLIQRIDQALYLYNTDYRDYPPVAAVGGGTIDDNVNLRTALLSAKEANGPYIEFNDTDVALYPGNKTVLVDAWGYALLYCHFISYDPAWALGSPAAQSWRVDKKKYEFQLLSVGKLATVLDVNNDRIVDNAELNGKVGDKAKDIINNW